MNEASKKKVFNFSLLSRVFYFVQPYRRLFYWSVLLAVLMATFAPVRPYLIQLTIDTATGKSVHVPQWLQAIIGNNALGDAGRFILTVTLFQIAFIVVETLIRFSFSFMTAAMGQHVVRDIRNAVYKKILSLNLRQFDQTPIGTLTTRTVDDIERINDIFSDGLIPIIADFLTIIITLATMFWMDWRLTLISLAPFPLMLVATYYFKESVKKSFTGVRNAVARLNAFVQEHVTGMQVVQAFAAEKREYRKFVAINAEHRNANIRAIFAYSIFFPVVEVVLAISTGLLVWWIAGKSLDAGLLTAFILYLNQIFRPLRVIADKFNVLQMGMVAAERVYKVLDNPDTLQLPKDKKSYQPANMRGEVVFDRVSFGYTPEKQVLSDISFHIKTGETVALVGHTGSGKTSIISLLNRLYEVQAGTISVDGVPVNEWEPDALRKGIGVVLQDVFLFSGSIMDNITLHNPAITREQVVRAASLIGVHDFIMQLPGNYDYHVMERGNTLSVGQRQLLSFIRALIYNPAILVLDEATSSIDTESEQLIEKAIDALISGRTAIVIAHRLSTIRKAHKIIVLDKGTVKEMGTHDELMALDGLYAQLYTMQMQRSKSVITIPG